MTRLELLKIVIGRARENGFELRRWYTTRLALPWTSAADAIATLEQHRNYYTLLFSHEFATAFWKPGADITFQVPAQSFQRRMHDGTFQTVNRKTFIRRSARKDAWRYHLREMALAEEPLRYIRRYLNVEEDFTDDLVTAEASAQPARSRKASTTPRTAAPKAAPKSARQLPEDPPAFLRRPYP
jgi:isopenicillin N synthase-like dioxygenase